LAAIPSPALGLIYVAIFGCGSIIGMGMISLLMGLCFSLASDRLLEVEHGVRMVIGALSTAFGIWMVVETGFYRGLFLT
jgi:hypothetical protein